MSDRIDRLVLYLVTSEAYPHTADSIEEIQTHISWVFLVDDFVYKLKKPVSLGFLDFSTLEKRRAACEQEVRLNRRLCSDVYLGVVPISEVGDEFVLNDDSNVVEVAVRMHRLTGGRFGHELVDEDQLGPEDLDRVVDALAAFYAEETPTAEMAAWGRADKLAISTDENFEQIEPFAGTLLARETYDAVKAYTNRFYETRARLLNERRAGGHILDCHGDLHLEHVYLREDDVCIYDCIEFNERLRTIDVASDVAFLAMDLDYHERPDLAVYFGEQMADRLRDADLLRVLDFYKCYRALVRGKVEGMRSDDDGVDKLERSAAEGRARAYFSLALRYAVAGSSPLVLVTMGRVGTGKSTLAGRLGSLLNWDVISSDRVRKELAGVDLYERGDHEARKQLYDADRSDEAYEALEQKAVDQVRLGRGVVIDATYSERRRRDALRETLEKAGATSCFLEMTATDATIRRRLRRRGNGEPSISDAREEDFDVLTDRYESPDDLETAFHFRVPTDEDAVDPLSASLHRLIRYDF